MNVINIAYYTFLRNMRDYRMYLFLILLPIVLIVILGNTLEHDFSPEDLDKVTVFYLNEDTGFVGESFNKFLESEEVRELLEITSIEQYSKGVKQVDDSKVEAFIYIPKKSSDLVKEGKNAEVQVKSNNLHTIVVGLVANYINNWNSNILISDITVGERSTENNKDYSNIQDVSITSNGQMPRAIDYYAVQTLLQALLIGALYGVYTVNEDKDLNTYIRLKTAPVKPIELLIGKAISNVGILFLQGVIVVLFSKHVYNANWGGSMAVNFITILIFSILVIGIGMMVGNMIKSSVVSLLVLWGIMIFFSMTAGAFMKLNQGSIFEKLGRLSPNYYAKTAIFNNIYNGSQYEMYLSILILTLIATGVFSTALIMGRRKIS